MSSSVALKRLRQICLALPEAEERFTWDHPNFRIRDKLFAIVVEEDGRPAVSFKAPEGSQAILVGADPSRFYVPPYVGSRGWVGMWLDRRVDWKEVAIVVERSYRLIAPKRLVRRLESKAVG